LFESVFEGVRSAAGFGFWFLVWEIGKMSRYKIVLVLDSGCEIVVSVGRLCHWDKHMLPDMLAHFETMAEQMYQSGRFLRTTYLQFFVFDNSSEIAVRSVSLGGISATKVQLITPEKDGVSE
jgi:hypothetical protein